MESSASNSEERELQQMQLEERHLHSKCMAWFKELNSHLETFHNNKRSGNENISYDNESCSLGDNATYAEKTLVDTVASNIEYANIESSYDSDTMSEVHHDIFENVFANEIQSHEQPDSISDTYVVDKNNIKDVNLQLNYFENGLVKEMKDDLKYVTSLEDEFDETCLILDIQQEFFKTQFESVKSESYSHMYDNEIFEQNSSLENKKRCLKKTISELSKQVVDVKEEMIKQCAQYSDEAKIKFDTKDLETINIELEYSVASLLKQNEHIGIESLLEVTAAKVCVTPAKQNLVLFSNLNEKYAK
ncbi:hypothetical protein Tco_0597534 [Tanacetum coccineum]